VLMKRNALALILILALVVSAVAGILLLKAPLHKTITVPDDYLTIQAAIDHANAGDRVFVKKGIYYTYLNHTQQMTINKPLSLIGENPETTFLDGINKSYVYVGWDLYPRCAFLSGINITSSDVTLSGFTIRNCDTAISLVNDETDKPISGIRIIGNNIINNFGDSYYSFGDSIVHYDCEANNILISGNNITSNGGGITIHGDNNACVIITGNNITNNGDGISLQASNSIISNNDITGNGNNGIVVSSCKNVTIQQNTIDRNGIHNSTTITELAYNGGLFLRWTGPFYVYYNNITGNSEFGIQFQGSNNSTVKNNNIINNGVGIRLFNYGYGAKYSSIPKIGSGNEVYQNNLVGNNQNAYIEQSPFFNLFEGDIGNGTDVVSWDNGVVGNYWSDYQSKYPNATEVDTSGVGNAPYVIDENNTDYCPLMHPVDISTEPPKSPIQETFPTAPVAVASIDFKKRKH
jgi:parallel beta-helix repeat protein